MESAGRARGRVRRDCGKHGNPPVGEATGGRPFEEPGMLGG